MLVFRKYISCICWVLYGLLKVALLYPVLLFITGTNSDKNKKGYHKNKQRGIVWQPKFMQASGYFRVDTGK